MMGKMGMDWSGAGAGFVEKPPPPPGPMEGGLCFQQTREGSNGVFLGLSSSRDSEGECERKSGIRSCGCGMSVLVMNRDTREPKSGRNIRGTSFDLIRDPSAMVVVTLGLTCERREVID